MVADNGLDEPDGVVDGNADTVDQIDETIATWPLPKGQDIKSQTQTSLADQNLCTETYQRAVKVLEHLFGILALILGVFLETQTEVLPSELILEMVPHGLTSAVWLMMMMFPASWCHHDSDAILVFVIHGRRLS